MNVLNQPLLEAVPNISEGQDQATLDAIGHAFTARDCSLLDVHSDPDYGRTVLTLLGRPQPLGDALAHGVRETVERLDIRTYRGAHPCIGVVDVVPIVYLRAEDRDTARGEALAVGNRLAGELELPVFLYGELAATPERRERAHFREGGPAQLADRLASRELVPDFGPPHLHPTAGATLIAARPPLVAFNIELGTADLDAAKAIAARVREQGGGLPGVRAIGVRLERQEAVHISTNVHDPFEVPLRRLVERVRVEAERDGVTVEGAELVGLAPREALEGFPKDVPLRGFDPGRHLLENRLRSM